MKLRMVLTCFLSSFNSSRLTLVCSGVTFSARSIIWLISLVCSLRPREFKRPARILRLEMRARSGVSRSKACKALMRVAMTSAS